MRQNTHKQSPAQTVVQIILLASTLEVIVATQALIKGKAQGSCVVPFRYANPIEGSWAPGTLVTVKVDDKWGAAERQAFGGSAEKLECVEHH